jgi:predicted esterase
MAISSIDLDRLQKRSFTLPLRCNYLLWSPPQPGEDTLLIIALHGHAMTPEQMLGLLLPLVGGRHHIASLQGPYQIWVNEGHERSKVAFHWATNYEPAYSRRLHHDMILHVLGEMGLPASRTVLAGFSQSVSLNYRFICTHPQAVAGAIAICGGIPGDWDDGPYQVTSTSVLHISTRDDEFYAPAVTGLYPERLRKWIPDIEFHMLDGGHRIPSAAGPIVREWLQRLDR